MHFQPVRHKEKCEEIHKAYKNPTAATRTFKKKLSALEAIKN